MPSTSSTLCPLCCAADETSTHRPGEATRSPRRNTIEFLHWLTSAAIVLLMPKCPLCLAAYIALGTGFGLSVATATYLRTALLITAALSLTYLALRLIVRWRQRSLRPARMRH